ncbi:MAG: hypothetical protein P8164_15055 [Gammaproteobacteria bacterium]|jgi:hypothetical protein
MKVIKVWVLTMLAILNGCAFQQTSPHPDVGSLLNAPPPQNREEFAQQCARLRQEIGFQRTKESTAATTLPGTTILNIQDEASRNIAALTAKYNKLGCNTVFKAQRKPAVPLEYGNYIDMCMAKCKQYTNRTPEQCFDACK